MDAFLTVGHTPTSREISRLCKYLRAIEEASVYMYKDEACANGKSMIGVLALGLMAGDSLRVSVVGDDEPIALGDAVDYITNVLN